MAKKKNIKDVTSQFERQLKAKELQIERNIVDLYSSLINQIAGLAAAQNLPSGVFTLEKLSVLNNRIDYLISQLNNSFEVIVRAGINDAWKLSNEKNDIFADIRLDKTLIPADRQLIFYDTNLPALKAFQERQINGIDLSERIYKAGEVFKSELEAGLGLGISKGQSAAEMARDLRQYLKEPDRLYRRIRDDKGNLKLSKSAEAYHPGTGTYRSSFQNIRRLTATETNLAYKQADNKRWANMKFVLGIEVHTSDNHETADICDFMVGSYSPDYVFVPFHPFCKCFAVPILMSDSQFNAYQKLVILGQDTDENIDEIAKPIQGIPKGATNWMEQNKERIAGWKNVPLFWQENPNFVPELPNK